MGRPSKKKLIDAGVIPVDQRDASAINNMWYLYRHICVCHTAFTFAVLYFSLQQFLRFLTPKFRFGVPLRELSERSGMFCVAPVVTWCVQHLQPRKFLRHMDGNY